MKPWPLIIILLFSNAVLICAQEPVMPDSTRESASFEETWTADTLAEVPLTWGDTLVVEEDLDHSATKALMYAVVLPGLGQAYNRKYWKMPIVWAAVGVSVYAVSFNVDQYRQASFNYIQDQSTYNEDYLKYWRRNMELSYIAAVAVYGLQILDAYVDALLFNWNVNDNLSMRIGPSFQPLYIPAKTSGQSIGLSACFTIKGKGR